MSVPRSRRVLRVLAAVTVMSGVSVVLGYGGWLVLSILAWFGFDPETTDGDPLRRRLLDRPDRNREVMRTNGRRPVPWRP